MVTSLTPPANEPASASAARAENWVLHAGVLWRCRHLLARAASIALLFSVTVAFTLPKRYESVARIMSPDQPGSGAMMLAALASRAGGLGGLSSMAGSLFSGRSSTALFVDLLHSGTVSGHLIDRFQLQKVYRVRYQVDTAKRLARRTTISDDKKSGVITIKVEDTSPVRARDLAQGYLDELNKLVMQTSTSSAHQERIFIEKRLHAVEVDLERAQLEFSEFSSKNSTIDMKEQTRALVDAAARLQAQLLVEESGLDSMRQIYGDGNVRIRATEARIATLQREIAKMGGSSSPLISSMNAGAEGREAVVSNELYPPLRQLPRLAVPYADLYRRVRVQEAVFELLTQQYEMARIEEAKDVPVVSVIDAPGVPEKKSFPPRLLLALALTAFLVACVAALVLMYDRWEKMRSDDARKVLAGEIWESMRQRFSRVRGQS